MPAAPSASGRWTPAQAGSNDFAEARRRYQSCGIKKITSDCSHHQPAFGRKDAPHGATLEQCFRFRAVAGNGSAVLHHQLGIFFDQRPTPSVAKAAYLRSDGYHHIPAYINTNGTTTWTKR
jgi:hypothetical protein